MNGRKEQNTLLHILRNPHGWSEETARDARLKAADELERLWGKDFGVKLIVGQLVEEINK